MHTCNISIKIIVDDNSTLSKHFKDKNHLRKLICLYQYSQLECCRNGKLSPEVGSSREKDMIASLCSDKILNINYDINNNEKEDVIINNHNVSIKHSSNKITSCNGLKIVWTSNELEQEKFVQNFSFTFDILLCWIRFDNKILDTGVLEVIYIKKDTLNKYHLIFTNTNRNIFKCLKGNSRGIEFNKDFFTKILQKSTFHIIVKFTNVDCNKVDPIEKRLKLLKIL
jgi:hypothetical protein